MQVIVGTMKLTACHVRRRTYIYFGSLKGRIIEMPECKITLKFECRRRWEELPESQELHRFCDQCEQNVYWVDNYDEASEHAVAGHCIAYQLPLGMKVMGPPPMPRIPLELPEELLEAYLTTKYCASTPHGEITIQIDKTHPELDLLLEEHDVEEWAFITASNPFSEELVQIVKELGYVAFEGAGVPASQEWNPEVSLLILGIDEDTAVDVGLEFGQNAIVLGWQDEVAELVGCRGR